MHNLFGNHITDKAIALLILFVLLMMGYLVLTNFYVEGLSQIENEISINRKKSGKVDAILSKEKFYQDKINQIRKEYSKNRIFLQSRQPTSASSEIQNTVKRLINTNTRAKILTIKTFPVIQHEGYSEVSVEIRMKDINHSEIQKMLYQIESQLPLIIVNELDVIRTQLQYKALVSKSGDQNDLNITLVVSGYFKDESS